VNISTTRQSHLSNYQLCFYCTFIICRMVLFFSSQYSINQYIYLLCLNCHAYNVTVVVTACLRYSWNPGYPDMSHPTYKDCGLFTSHDIWLSIPPQVLHTLNFAPNWKQLSETVREKSSSRTHKRRRTHWDSLVGTLDVRHHPNSRRIVDVSVSPYLFTFI